MSSLKKVLLESVRQAISDRAEPRFDSRLSPTYKGFGRDGDG